MSARLYTFLVAIHEEDDVTDYDEIDVHASNPDEALRLARIEADDLYGTDSELTPTEPGGSAGTFTVWSSAS
jgi:hypothetical protein